MFLSKACHLLDFSSSLIKVSPTSAFILSSSAGKGCEVDTVVAVGVLGWRLPTKKNTKASM